MRFVVHSALMVSLVIAMTGTHVTSAWAHGFCQDHSCDPFSANASASFSASAVQALPSGILRGDVEDRNYTSYATEVMDNLLTFGTDRYGSVQSTMLVSILDVVTKNAPTDAQLPADEEAIRVERRQRRAPGGFNFALNQSIYKSGIAI